MVGAGGRPPPWEDRRKTATPSGEISGVACHRRRLLGAAPPRAPSCPCTRCAPRRGCAIAYIQTLWLACAGGPLLGKGKHQVALRNPCDRCAGARPRPQIALRGPHKSSNVQVCQPPVCLTFMHCALHGTFLGITPRCTLPPPTSRVRRAAGAAKGLLAHHGAAHLCPIPPLPYRCPGRHGGAHCLPTSCELALAPLAPPHTRRFLGDSFN